MRSSDHIIVAVAGASMYAFDISPLHAPVRNIFLSLDSYRSQVSQPQDPLFSLSEQ